MSGTENEATVPSGPAAPREPGAPQPAAPATAPATEAAETPPAPQTQGEPEEATAPAPVTTPDAPVAAGESARKRSVRWRRVAAVAGSLVMAGVLVAGVGWTVVTVRDADRDAGAPRWKLPEDAAGEKAPEARGLAGMLVPYGYDNWLPGPDLAEFGADARLDGAAAAALQKKVLRDLPRSQRKRMEKLIDSWRVEGMAMRSYLSGSTSVYSEVEVSSVGIMLTRMKDREAVRDLSRFQNEFFDTLDIFRQGPKIEGHKNARCFLPPKDEEPGLDTMRCSAYVGDVLVTLTADGGKPLDTKSVAVLLGQQLDRIDNPGKAV